MWRAWFAAGYIEAVSHAIIGNQVRVLNSPAAVLTSKVSCSVAEQSLDTSVSEKAKQFAIMSKSENLPHFNGLQKTVAVATPQ